MVAELSAQHEAGRPAPWAIGDAPRDYIDALKRGIVGVALHAEKVEAKRKLSQNKSAADLAGVARGLAGSDDAMAQEVAALMHEARPLSGDPEGN